MARVRRAAPNVASLLSPPPGPAAAAVAAQLPSWAPTAPFALPAARPFRRLGQKHPSGHCRQCGAAASVSPTP